MSVAETSAFAFEDTFARELPGLAVPWQPAGVEAPRLLVLNDELAAELGLDAEWLRSPAGVAALAGDAIPPGASPVAMAYAGHQFGGYSPRLGDGRALLLGELLDAEGHRRDLHLKGSGRTPFARGGDGKAAVGPMLREYVIGEAVHALGSPTTRGLAVAATGEEVIREAGALPGAVLARVASSHIRVGTFEYAARLPDGEALRRLADYSIARHHPEAAESERPYVTFYESVLEAQAELVARWMLVGFIHGVMNTDNMAISGETIDYGPCAFMDAFDPATVFSSIDHAGRYAYGNQPAVAQWNLARLAETLVPLIDPDTEAAVAAVSEVLRSFPDRYASHWLGGLRAKLGLREERPGDGELADDLLALLRAQEVDFTSFFRGLAAAAGGDPAPARGLFAKAAAFDAWAGRWRERLESEAREPAETMSAMNAVNPIYIPRNHLVEEALEAGTAGDLEPFERLLEVVRRPFEERPGLERFAEPAPADSAPYRTFCGT